MTAIANHETVTIEDIATALPGLFDAWDAREFSAQHASDLARFMNRKLSVRDAFVVHVISPKTSREDLMLLAIHPHTVRARTMMDRIITETFTSGDFDSVHVLREGQAMADLIPGIPADIPCANIESLTAYLLWWAGDLPDAMEHAAAALELDERCSLASIVIAAIQKGVVTTSRSCPGFLPETGRNPTSDASGGPRADRPALGNPRRRETPGPKGRRHAHGGARPAGSLRSEQGAPRRGAA